MKWELQFHAGNPKMCRVKGPVFHQNHKCEGGGWFTDEPTARLIAEAPAMRELLAKLRRTLQDIESDDDVRDEIDEIDALLRKVDR